MVVSGFRWRFMLEVVILYQWEAVVTWMLVQTNERFLSR